MNLEVIERAPNGPAHSIPLLFVHGMFVGAWCWDEFFLPFFAENGYRAVALSLRGHAGSEGHANMRWHSIDDYVKDVEQVVSQLGISPVIIGCSMGGFVTQKYLEKHDAPAAVLLASAPPTTLLPMAARMILRNPLPLLEAIFTLRTHPVIKTPQLAHWLLFSPDFPEETLMKYYPKMEDESFRAFLDLLGLNLAHPKRVKAPLLVLGAENDWAIGPDTKATARAYNVKQEILPSVGHYMILEAGWKSAAERILAWLKEKGI
jgi:pimeloyl-ACP methyl ester carboxylesterase